VSFVLPVLWRMLLSSLFFCRCVEELEVLVRHVSVPPPLLYCYPQLLCWNFVVCIGSCLLRHVTCCCDLVAVVVAVRLVLPTMLLLVLYFRLRCGFFCSSDCDTLINCSIVLSFTAPLVVVQTVAILLSIVVSSCPLRHPWR